MWLGELRFSVPPMLLHLPLEANKLGLRRDIV